MNKIEIIPLGTVSPYCKQNNNCPGFLVKSLDDKILLDCGNGICRFLHFPSDLENLIVIISHLHKDHYADLTSLGYASYVYKNLGLIKHKIKIYIPSSDINSSDFQYLMNFKEENYLEFISYNKNDILSHGNMKISFSLNPHQITTHSIKISTHAKTVVYSSDTGYVNNCLESFAKDCDLLICESSFLKGQIKKSDNHLYAYEAALIAKKANAKNLMLTHFWPEISKQKYVNEAKKIFKNVFYAREKTIITI